MKKVIKFYATWCGPCKLYAKTFDKVAEELKDQATFEEVNIEKDTQGLGKIHDVQSIPTTVIIEGDSIKKISGRINEEDLKTFILGE